MNDFKLFSGHTLCRYEIISSNARVAVDALFALCGFLLGGTVGLGTLICMFLVGPVAGVFLPVNGRIIEGIVSRFFPS